MKRCFRWAAGEKLIPASVFHDLQTVEGLRYGRSQAKETEPVEPVPVEDVEATLPFLPPVVADMVRVQLATGMRAGRVDQYAADRHRHHGQGLALSTCPAQDPTSWPSSHRCHRSQGPGHHPQVPGNRDADAYLFSPRETIRLFREDQRRHRQTPVQPSSKTAGRNHPRRNPANATRPAPTPEPSRTASARLTPTPMSAIPTCPRMRSLSRAGQATLRHTAALTIQREFGLDAARAVLGHRTPILTSHLLGAGCRHGRQRHGETWLE